VLAALEAREHTAQVVKPGERERRERRFRWENSDTTKERDGLRRLPYLVCSPTMELGVDIADLDLDHLRNVPPAPANYAQGGRRADRQGQPGLIFTYCGAIDSHDQYFFQRRASPRCSRRSGCFSHHGAGRRCSRGGTVSRRFFIAACEK
jgi:ATP-dependent helicase YprA (DUF1998 family)